MEPNGVTFIDHDVVLAECEILLRQTLDLVDGYRVNRVIGARLAHLLHDVSQERRSIDDATDGTTSLLY